MTKRFDYIVVGAGSAGCVLANRLTESPATSVLLLEGGGSDRSLLVKMPAAFPLLSKSKRFNWHHVTEREPYADNRRIACPRGKALGGSSSINGMVYVRGHACDFDEWEELGATGWSYKNCLPYFQKAESFTGGRDAYRGDSGPLHTDRNDSEHANPLFGAFIEAGVQAGYGETSDPNGHLQEGFGLMNRTMRNGARWSASDAYLKPAMSRPNLCVLTNAMTKQVLLDGKRAVGVAYEKGGQIHEAHANREVILSSGAIGSPQLLQCSGIGPAAVLKAANVEVKHELRGVGENLHDHPEVWIQYKCRKPITLNGRLGLLGQLLIGVRWMLFRDGLGASNHFEAGGFIRSDKGLRWPDIQYHFFPCSVTAGEHEPTKFPGFMAFTGPNKTKSRGHLRIKSGDASQHPAILFNYLKEETDRDVFRKSVRLTREIFGQPAMDQYVDGELSPGIEIETDDEIDAFVRGTMETAYHPCGSCKMGQDEMAVVGPDLRVHGIDGLRVVDASTFPQVTNGNLNAPTIMVAERASDLIRALTPLAPSDAKVGLAAGWQTAQRPHEAVRKMDRAS
jgi:choline dehydrogenase